MTEPTKFGLIDNAITHPSGARYFKCALQVNPFDYLTTYQGAANPKGEDDYNSALAAACNENGVEVVGVADHGNVDRVDKLRATLESWGIVVFPGFEIASTEKIHMVCLFEPKKTSSDLNRFLGALGVPKSDEKVRPSEFACVKIAKMVLNDLNGIWYAAHIPGKNGLLRLDGSGQNFVHIWKAEDVVLAGQIAGSIEGVQSEYQSIIRNLEPAYRRKRPIALINASDVGSPESLGKLSASCRIKMTAPSIEALKQAFYDPESRIVRALEMVQAPAKSKIIAAAWEGGFLDGIQMHFSDNLNALIGGRGTGKSTVIESLRFAFGKEPSGKEARDAHAAIVRDVLGSGSRIHIRLSSGRFLSKPYTIRRQFGAAPEVFDEDGALSQYSPEELLPGLQIIGQNEILEIARDPDSQIHLVNRFIPDSAPYDKRITEVRRRLADNRRRLLKQQEELDELITRVNRLPKIEEQIAGYRKLNLEEKLGAARKLGREGAVFARIKEDFESVTEGIRHLRDCATVDFAYVSVQSLADLPNKEMLQSAAQIVKDLSDAAQAAASSIQGTAGELRQKLDAATAAWQKSKNDIERTLQDAASSIPDFAGKRGQEIGNEFAGLLKESEAIRPLESRRIALDAAINETRKERDELLSEWASAHFERFRSAEKRIAELNGVPLKGKVRLRVQQCKGRGGLVEFLTGIEGIGAKKAAWAESVEGLMILTLVGTIKAGKDALLSAYKSCGLSSGVADRLIAMTKEELYKLEEVELHDTVEIELNTAHDGSPPEYRLLGRLSMGQKCTAILHLLMLQSDDPLIIDQPEDNLDNAFIAERIVKDLRAAKCKRQFLFSTHNANIPVFGDAEWIGVLTYNGTRAELRDENVGSIDKPTVQDAVKQVLEGGNIAFETRKLKYGF